MTNRSIQSSNVRTFDSWLNRPTQEDLICVNRFRNIVMKVFYGSDDPFDPNPLDLDDFRTKTAKLIQAHLIILGGDVIYVREGKTLHTLGDSRDLLAYYLHSDTREAQKAIELLETNFMGYKPVSENLVCRDSIDLLYPDGDSVRIDVKALEIANGDPHFDAEYGQHEIVPDNFEPISKFFGVLNNALGEKFFLEKMMMYYFNQSYREKSFVLVGGGGNGKSMFMGLVQRLFGDFAMTDAPQPTFSGHAPAVVAYNFIGKRMVTFNDVGDPSEKFLEWLKRMITGKLEVKTPSGAWLTVPCNANFMMETNHAPQILSLEAHRRRFIIREFDSDFKLKDHMTNDELDILGERGSITAGDIVNYLLTIKDEVKDWKNFDPEPDIDFSLDPVLN